MFKGCSLRIEPGKVLRKDTCTANHQRSHTGSSKMYAENMRPERGGAVFAKCGGMCIPARTHFQTAGFALN